MISLTTLLPGGYTSPERFVRTAYLKAHIPVPKKTEDSIMSCFHIIENVSIPRGAVISSRGSYDYTKYTAFINTNTCEYFFRTYDNMNIAKVGLFDNYEWKDEPFSLGKLAHPMVFQKWNKK
ncbi:linear amide C-N hydrolase [Haloimpatiens sp. FM7315]|uniref:linear amide C-N hydrolase n=1 Tax=Haloimpatiens sp. FM7315 TaxID=3298609 RepID=UPI0035A289C6